MILNDAINKYERFLKVTRSKGTVDYYNGKVGILSQYLGYIHCEDINEDILLDFIIKQRERNTTITNKTINKYVGSLRQTLKYSCKMDIEFSKLPEVKKLIQTIPLDVVNMIFSFYRRNQSNLILQRNYIMFRLFYETGLRLSELLHLKVRDFNFERNTIHVKKTKTNVERYVFYSQETKDLLVQYIYLGKLDYYIFIDFTTGEIIKGHTVQTICKRLRNKLGIDISINPHKWRHTFATNFVKKNGNMEVLRQIMGHTSLKTTQKYLHINVDDIGGEYFRLYN